MRTVYDARREHDRDEDMDEFDKFLVDEYEADRYQEVADRAEDERLREEAWEQWEGEEW